MAIALNSVLAPEMTAYAEMLYGADRDTEEYHTVFKSLDKYLAKENVKVKELSESVVLEWLNSLTVVRRTKNGYISRIRKFARYLMAMGIPAYEPDFCRDIRTFIEYTFSDEEFDAIIEVADTNSELTSERKRITLSNRAKNRSRNSRNSQNKMDKNVFNSVEKLIFKAGGANFPPTLLCWIHFGLLFHIHNLNCSPYIS